MKSQSLLLTALLALGSVPVFAAEPAKTDTAPAAAPAAGHDETPAERRVRMLKNYEDVLTDLTPEQKTRLLAVLEPTSDAIRAARKDDKLTEEQYRTKILKLHADAAAKVDQILTDSQRGKWSEAREKKRKERERLRKAEKKD